MQINFRKVVSALASATMIGSTVALAAAANYPAPFVQNGTPDVAIVYGSTAAPTDMVAVTDVTANLNSKLAAQAASTTSSSSGVSGGDFVKIDKSSDKLNLGDTMSGTFGTTVDSDDLKVLLADGKYSNDENTEYNYEQRLYLQARQLTYFADSDYKVSAPTEGFQITSSTPILNYTLDFTTDAESDVVSGDLADLETTDLNILGKKFYVLDAKNDTGSSATSSSYFGKFTLLDSASTATIAEGETKTVTVGSKSYDVAIDFIGSASVKLKINGVATNSLAEGDTQRLADGSYVGIRDILVQDYAGGTKKVEFSVGSGKLEVEANKDVELNDEGVDGVKGWFIKGTVSSGRERLDKLVIEWSADDEVFVAPGSDLTMPGFKAVKLSMGGFVVKTPEVITVDYAGDDVIELTAPIKDGEAKISLLQVDSVGNITLVGKDTDERLATSNNNTLLFYEKQTSNDYHDKFVATYNTTTDAESYVLSASVEEKDGKNRTTIKNEITGANVCADKAPGDSCDVGDVSLTISTTVKNSTVRAVTLIAGTNVNFNTLFTKGGLKVYLPIGYNTTGTTGVARAQKGDIDFNISATSAGHNQDSFVLFFDEENKDDDKGAGTSFNVTINNDADFDVHVSAVGTGQSNLDVPGASDDTTSRVLSDLGTKVDKLVASDRGKAKVTYSGSQAYAEVFLTDTSATVAAGNATTIGTASVVDTEVASVSGKNLIVVGGSCVNKFAAELLGLSAASCGADWEAKTGVSAGNYLIQTFARTGGKVATLVAGYNAGDTTNAAKYLTTQTVDTTAGKKYKGTSETVAAVVQ